MKHRKSFAVVGASAAMLLSPATHAALVGFDDIANTANGIQIGVVSGGFNFNGDHFHIVDSAGAFVRNASTSYLAAEAAQGLGRPVTMTRSGGGNFTLNQVDVAEVWLPGEPLNDFFEVLITANQFGGGVFSLAVTLDGIRDGIGGVADFQTVFLAGWTNLTDVTFTGRNAAGAFGDYSIDNLIVDERNPVPEPGTLALLGLGIAGLGLSRRRNANVSARC